MDISLLKTFLVVAKTRHFGRAADILYITQSAVSARIKLLEETLGVDLFIRKRNNIQLTPAGNRLHQHAESIVKGWERAVQAIALDDDHSSALSAGCIFDLWRIFVERWARGLRRLTPGIALQIEIHTVDVLIQRLTLGVLDVAFMFDPPHTVDLELKQVTTIPLILVSSTPGQTVQQALQENYVMVDWGSAFGMVHADRFPDLPPPTLRTNSGEVALGLLQEKGGSAYLPQGLVRHQVEQGGLHVVAEAPEIDRLGYIVYRPENLGRRSIAQAVAACTLPGLDD